MSTQLENIDRSFNLYGPIDTQSCRRIQSFCRAPYPRHPHGCPNFYGRCNKLKLFTALYLPEVSIGILRVDFGDLLKLRSGSHPEWSDAQLRNPIQWQDHFRAQLRVEMAKQKALNPQSLVEDTPEGRGVNVFEDLRSLGVPIERKPTNNLFLVSYLCYPKSVV
jgi:hypothetical protein